MEETNREYLDFSNKKHWLWLSVVYSNGHNPVQVISLLPSYKCTSHVIWEQGRPLLPLTQNTRLARLLQRQTGLSMGIEFILHKTIILQTWMFLYWICVELGPKAIHGFHWFAFSELGSCFLSSKVGFSRSGWPGVWLLGLHLWPENGEESADLTMYFTRVSFEVYDFDLCWWCFSVKWCLACISSPSDSVHWRITVSQQIDGRRRLLSGSILVQDSDWLQMNEFPEEQASQLEVNYQSTTGEGLLH